MDITTKDIIILSIAVIIVLLLWRFIRTLVWLAIFFVIVWIVYRFLQGVIK